MPTEQSAMQQLIERLEKTNQEYYNKYKISKGYDKTMWDNAMSVQTIAVINAKDFIEVERKQIEDSFNKGYNDGDRRKVSTGEDHYNKTYPLSGQLAIIKKEK